MESDATIIAYLVRRTAVVSDAVVSSYLNMTAIADSEVIERNCSVVLGDGSSRASNDCSCTAVTVSDNGVVCCTISGCVISGEDGGMLSNACNECGNKRLAA